jgi:hypothetical protein
MTARRRGFAGRIEQMFNVARRRAGMAEAGPKLCGTSFRRPSEQLKLWD